MEKIIKILERKGLLSSLVGLSIAGFLNGRIIYLFYKNQIVNDDYSLIFLAVMNTVAVLYLILPSSIKISGKGIEIEIKD